MPIGFDSGDGGGIGGSSGGATTGTPDIFVWPEIEAAPLLPVVWTRWQTMFDERVCPECGPLNGLVWPDGDGPSPPLHVNCRCGRVYAFTEWRTRR